MEKALIRKTKVSQAVLEILKGYKKPISIGQIKAQLQKEALTPNKTTLYRIMDKLKDKGDVQEIVFKNGVTYYEWIAAQHHHHHHHFFCTVCEKIACMTSCILEKAGLNLKALLPNKKYQLNSHEFHLYGTCDNCHGVEA